MRPVAKLADKIIEVNMQLHRTPLQTCHCCQYIQLVTAHMPALCKRTRTSSELPLDKHK